MRKRLVYGISFLAILFCVLIQDVSVQANTIDDIEGKLKDLEKEESELKEKRGNIESEKGTTDEKITENKTKQNVIEGEISKLDDQLRETINSIYETEEEIASLGEEITDLTEQIEELDEGIDELIIRIKERDELLKNRLRSIQETGGLAHYIEVLFGSQSFTDFISRSSAVNTIMDQDIKIMNEQAADKQALEVSLVEVQEKKEEVEEKKDKVESQKESLIALKSTLDGQVNEKETLMAELEVEYNELDEYKLTLEEEQKLILAQEDSIVKAREAAASEKNRLEQLAKEEEERRKKEEAAAKAAEEQKKKDNTNAAPSTPAPPASDPEPEVGTGGPSTFIWPTTSRRITSGYGPRVHPVTKEVGRMHYGIDFGIYLQPVYASASGVVTSTHSMSGYGKTVVITHFINGQTYTTLYAHLDSIPVSPGQLVTQGDTIGISGNTGGSSTGYHLHFEIHNGPWNVSKSNSVNPLGYLP